MQRIHNAISHKRCVFVTGAGIVGSSVETEIAKKGLHAVSLTTDSSANILPFSAETLAPATENQGIIVLVEPDFSEPHLESLATFITSQTPRPQLFIVAKFYNRFSMPMSLMNLKMTHFKHNATNFFRGIPKLEIKEKSTVSPAKKASVAFKFIGRTEELDHLNELLNTKGTPICLKGIEGIGKRYLIEAALDAQAQTENPWTRVPDLHINDYLHVDALLGRLAHTFNACGDDRLLKGLSGKKRISIDETLVLLEDSLQNENLASYCFIISGLHNRLNSRKSFNAFGLMEMVLHKLWSTETNLKLVFLTTQLPNSANNLRTMTLRGFNADEAKELIEVWQAPTPSEEELATIMSRTKGHPLALRFLLIKSLQEGNYGLLNDDKFAKMNSVQDFRQLRKMVQKLTNKLTKDEVGALKTIAVFNAPTHAKDLTDMGINRKMRAALLMAGILEQTPSQSNRRYYAHELVHSVYKTEDIFDYNMLEDIAERQMEKSKDNSAKFNQTNPNPLLELAYLQEANAMFWAARKRKRIWKTPLPCIDAIISSAIELSGRKPNKKVDFGHIADLQIKDGLQMAPNHPELLFLEAKRALFHKEKRKNADKIFAERRNRAMMPKFILEESKLLSGRAPAKAIEVLQEGLKHFGDIEDIWFKMANLLNKQGQSKAALETVNKAITLHPTSPAYHSLRGDLLSKMGSAHWEDASAALAKASELYSGNAPSSHILREIDMLTMRAMVDVDNQVSLLTTAKEQLESSLTKEPDNIRVQVALAGILLDLDSEDFEAIEGLLAKALQKRDNSDAHLYKARLLIRQNNLIDVENNLDRAFKLSRNSAAVNSVRGEYYLLTDNPVLALKAFQSALDASPANSPQAAQAKRYVEQVAAILAATANVNYAAIGEDSINVVPMAEDNARPAAVIRKRSSTDE